MNSFSPRVNTLLKEMTLNEKIGQTFQIVAGFYHEEGIKIEDLTGPITDETVAEDVLWNIGSIIDNASCDPERNRRVQETFLEHNRLGIPLLFMADIIHGYKTCFPIPLAMTCAFDPEPVLEYARTAAAEARAAGIHVTFSPMLDLSRDCRWGRVMEGPGEDPFLGEMAARAYVEGYQGANEDELKRQDRLAATLKHFAGYGFVMGGRDYDETDITEHTLREYVLRAFKAGVEAGAELVMSSFTTFEGVPANGNKKLMQDILRGELGFKGVLISDCGSINRIQGYHVAASGKEASRMAVDAGCDIDMMGFRYINDIKTLLAEKKMTMEQLDEMVGRILTLKEKLGLFEDPFKGISKERTDALYLCEDHRAKARRAAQKSMVLLQNNGLLPFSKDVKTVAVIGPNGGDININGNWSSHCDCKDSVKVYEGVQNAIPGANVLLERGCEFTARDEALLHRAVEAAKQADLVLLALGEKDCWSGEACSTTNIALTPCQMELARAVVKANPKTVALLINGRPMDLTELSGFAPAILECWFPGTEGGNAIADLVFGDVEPTGRLAMSFPYCVGQVPTYYNRSQVSHYNPSGSPNVWFQLRYSNCSIHPRFAFGHGLGYTKFSYKGLTVPAAMIRGGEITVSCTVANEGDRPGTETVQLYLRDEFAQVIRPLKELKGVQKVTLQPGEERLVSFTITEEMLKYHHRDFSFCADAGAFQVFIGHDSTVEEYKVFELKDEYPAAERQ